MKFIELKNLNLNGYTCFFCERDEKGTPIYHLQKENPIEKGKFLYIKGKFENLEFQCLHDLTDTKIKY